MANCRNCGHELKPDLRFLLELRHTGRSCTGVFYSGTGTRCSRSGTFSAGRIHAAGANSANRNAVYTRRICAGAIQSVNRCGVYAGRICTATARRTSTAYTGWLHSASTGRIPAPGIRRTRAGSKTAFIR